MNYFDIFILYIFILTILIFENFYRRTKGPGFKVVKKYNAITKEFWQKKTNLN